MIVPFREKGRKITRCLESIKKQDYKNLEVIVVSDRTELKREEVISILSPESKGPGSKRNLGAKRAKGDILFFVDSDSILKTESVSKLVNMFHTYEVDAVSGKPLAYRKSNLLGYITGLEYEDRFEQMGEGFVDVAATTCLGVKRSVFFKVGGFEDYSIGEAIGEDWDFSAKLRNMKYTIYHTNEVEIYHDHNAESLRYYLKLQYEHAKYRTIHYKKYGETADQYSSWIMILSATLLLGLPATIRIFNRTKNLKVLVLPFISLLRTVAWFSGAAAGIFSSTKFSNVG